MRYHIEFAMPGGRRFTFDGTKYMQKDADGGCRASREMLEDYTTLYCHVYEQMADGTLREMGTGVHEVPHLRGSGGGGQPGGLPDFVPGDRDERPDDSVAGAHALHRVHGAVRAAGVRSAGILADSRLDRGNPKPTR